ncbi:hypothetical protein FRC04_001158 [Tulasnella sp. 424]|nr:hypothetical protein FRC04_001158 [Tulasnella sp. 424]KAG8972749.1 hypothetical protein FRC05_009579 [Tulasnella sp. 425]
MLDPAASDPDNTGDSKADVSPSSPSISSPPVLASDSPLALEEILWLIFQFAEPASLAVAARVCRNWSGTALDELWRTLPSIYPLLTLLVPRNWILDATEYHKNLLDSLAKANWDRFRGYAARIRSVRVDYDEEENLPFDTVALVQAFHGPSPLMPNVKTISWRFFQNKNFTSILPFIGHQLENLDLTMVKGIDDAERSQLVRSLAHRTANLRSLRLLSFTKIRHMDIPLATLISSSPKLVNIKLPAFFLTKEVVAAIAKLQFLTKLYHSGWLKAEKVYRDAEMCFEFTPESFPQLETLAFAALPTRMAKVFDATDHVGRLRSVYLDCPAFNSSKEIETVFAKLAAGGSRLDSVQLMCCPVYPLVSSSLNDSVSIDTIRPLFSCTRLGSLQLWAPHFVPLNEEDVVEMGKNWPLMHTLNLCPAPLAKKDQGTGFDILAAFAKSFPHLRILRLFFNKEIPAFDGDLHPVSRFRALERLGVGLSPAAEGKASEIGFLIASLCQSPPAIDYGTTGNRHGNDIPEEQMTKLAAGWSEVVSFLNLAFRIKNSYTRKYGGLMESNAELAQEAS